VSRLVALLLLASCAPKNEYAARPAPLPDPLPPSEFDLPDPEVATLSNGMKVVVATNRETPLWDVRILFDVGSYADPEGKEGLASVTLDMMNDGAGGLSAEELSKRLRLLGSRVNSSAYIDGAVISAAGQKAALAETLDLWASVVLKPDFPAKDWEILQKQRLAELRASREDPSKIAQRVTPRVLYGETYRGRLVTEASLGAITPDDMRSFQQRFLGPENAILVVGGDLGADEIVPLLEARLGAWKPTVESPSPDPRLLPVDRAVTYLVDKPGAAQSVIRAVLPAGKQTDPDYFALLVGNEAFGGSFMGRVNMKLREEKGYTYGAYCSLSYTHGPGLWACGAGVETSVTGPALTELRALIDAVTADAPLAADEVAYHQKGLVQGYPARFEVTEAILDVRSDIWQYGLPEDWAERFVPEVKTVTTESANAALRARVDPKKLTWIVVGDAAKIRADVEAFGLPVVELDRDGRPVAAPTGGN
jgi:zinc protease